MSRSKAEIVREYGPFPGVENVGGVTHDGRDVWFAAGDKLVAFDPASGKTTRSLDVAAHARSSSWRGPSTGSMQRCSPSSPTANRGRVRPWRWRWARASAPCSGRSTRWRKQARYSRSVAGGLVAG